MFSNILSISTFEGNFVFQQKSLLSGDIFYFCLLVKFKCKYLLFAQREGKKVSCSARYGQKSFLIIYQRPIFINTMRNAMRKLRKCQCKNIKLVYERNFKKYFRNRSLFFYYEAFYVRA